MSDKKIASAIYVYENLLVYKDTAAYLMARFDEFGQQYYLNSMEKLRILAVASKGESELALWNLQSLQTLIARKVLHAEIGGRDLIRNPKSNDPKNNDENPNFKKLRRTTIARTWEKIQ